MRMKNRILLLLIGALLFSVSNSEAATRLPTWQPTIARVPSTSSPAVTAMPTKRPTTGRPTRRPTTRRPTTAKPTKRPSSPRPTKLPTTRRPTTAKPTKRPTTSRPTKLPTTLRPTRVPTITTPRPTRVPTSKRPTSAPAPTAMPKLKLLIPAYFYPSFMGSPWNMMTSLASSGVPVMAVMNPDNGPGPTLNPDYLTATAAFRQAGGLLIGYVYSCYGRNLCVNSGETRSVSQIVSDVQRYNERYGPLAGIFVDEVSDREEDLAFYADLYLQLQLFNQSWTIVGNPGYPCPESYLNYFDILLTAEGSVSSNIPQADWALQYPADRQAYLFYGTSEGDMPSKIAIARSRNVGYIYITDDTLPNPWDTLASYMEALVSSL